jgi:exopolysaccharide biosynthesis WecB/TagA/CpsF family protein
LLQEKPTQTHVATEMDMLRRRDFQSARLFNTSTLAGFEPCPIHFPVDAKRWIPIHGESIDYATALLAKYLTSSDPNSRPITVAFLNMRNHVEAADSPGLVEAFTAMDHVFPDGVGLQVGRHILGLEKFSRLSGTEIVPALLRAVDIGCRVFTLGGTPQVCGAMAKNVGALFPRMELRGYHHGYFDRASDEDVVQKINASQCDLLLIGMGTPTQELWLHRNRHKIKARLAICVGGLFHYWSQDIVQAPRLLSRIGFEWLWILAQQPFKWRVYTVGAWRYVKQVAQIAAQHP